MVARWCNQNVPDAKQRRSTISERFEPEYILDDECEQYVAYLMTANESKEMAFLSIAVDEIEMLRRRSRKATAHWSTRSNYTRTT